MNQILTNKQLDEQLLKDGYVVVPFLDEMRVKELFDFFYDNHASEIPGFYATAHSTDIPFRKKMNEQIKAVFEQPIKNYFNNSIPLGGSYVVKSKSQEERLHPHQDWNIVDESKFRSFNIWVPLVNLNEENGAIRVVPESHLWVSNFRGPNIPDYFGEYNEVIWNRMTTLNMKAGEALIYDHRLFHASFANKTDELRIATVFGIIPSGAQMLYYYGNNHSVDVYESNVNFFMEGNIQKGPEVLRKIQTISPPTVHVRSLPEYLVKQKTTENTTVKKAKPNLTDWVKNLFK